MDLISWQKANWIKDSLDHDYGSFLKKVLSEIGDLIKSKKKENYFLTEETSLN